MLNRNAQKGLLRQNNCAIIAMYFVRTIFLLIAILSGNSNAAICSNAESNIVAYKNSGGAVTEAGVEFKKKCVEKGDAITLTITPNAGHCIQSVTVDGIAQTINTQCEPADIKVTAGTSRKTAVKVAFHALTYQLLYYSTDTDISIAAKSAFNKYKYNQKVKFTLTKDKSIEKTPELLVDGEVVELKQIGKTNKFVYVLAVTGNHEIIAKSLPPSSVTISQGIWGYVRFWKGDFMPGPDGPSGTKTLVVREIYIHEATTFSEVTKIDYGPFYSSISSKLITTTTSDEKGLYQIELTPGTYSIFVKEGDSFYANGGTDEFIKPADVLSGAVTQLPIEITYEAYE